jgi:hypothetical protein
MQGILGQRIAKKWQLCSLVLIKFSNKSRYRRRLQLFRERQWSANLIWSYAARRPRAASLSPIGRAESATCRINWRCAAQNVFFSSALELFFLSRRASLMKSKFNKSAAGRTKNRPTNRLCSCFILTHSGRAKAPVWPNFRPTSISSDDVRAEHPLCGNSKLNCTTHTSFSPLFGQQVK